MSSYSAADSVKMAEPCQQLEPNNRAHGVMDRPCMTCYKDGAASACTHCHARRYCSRECQVKDWKNCHKFYCCRSGELDHDFEIKDSPDKIGVGIFAKRRFSRGEIIVAESPLFMMNPDEPNDLFALVHDQSDELSNTLNQLNPFDQESDDVKGLVLHKRSKIVRNAVGPTTKKRLCAVLARINHDCCGNATVIPSIKCDAMLLRCTDDIKPGEEILHCYLQSQLLNITFNDWHTHLLKLYGFTCKCRICSDDSMIKMFDKATDLLRRARDCWRSQFFKKAAVAQKLALKILTYLRLGGPPILLNAYADLCHYDILPRNEAAEVRAQAAAVAQNYIESLEELGIADDEDKRALLILAKFRQTMMDFDPENRLTLPKGKTGSEELFGASPICGSCYKSDPTISCSECRRQYCDFLCQMADSEDKAHKDWCGKAGLLGIDFTVNRSPGKGVGLFAKRNFQRNEVLLVEAPVFVIETESRLEWAPDTSVCFVHTCQSLQPENGEIVTKITSNLIRYDEKNGGLFPVAARINHSCLGNTRWTWSTIDNVIIFRCISDISAGEEKTYPYLIAAGETMAERQLFIKDRLGFCCSCPACSNSRIADKIGEKQQLLARMIVEAESNETDDAKRTSRKLVSILDELKAPHKSYMLVYALLCSVCMRCSHRMTTECSRYAKKALWHASRSYEEHDDIIAMWKKILENPNCITRRNCQSLSVRFDGLSLEAGDVAFEDNQ